MDGITSTVIWHRYPEEKPSRPGTYLVFVEGNIEFGTFNCWKDGKKPRWDYVDCSLLIENPTHWAYMPEGPAI